MKIRLLLLAMAAPTILWAQKPNKPILKIGQAVSTYGEFDHMYQQNNQTAMTPIGRAEYLDLFINYKLKVAEARALRLDTTATYKEESEQYLNELNNSFMLDTTADRRLTEVVKSRMSEDVHAAHILVSVKPNATPADTAKAYAKIKEARERVLAGMDFSEVAHQYSDDPSAEANNGDLGYFSAFQMVQEFEDAAFTTPVGQTSSIIRSRFGYHILHVYDRRPHEEYLVQNFMKFYRPDMTDAEKAYLTQHCDSVVRLAREGVDFPSLILKHSDDKAGAKHAGMMPWFSKEEYNRQGLPEFGDMASKMKPGEFSAPFATRYGVHVIRLVEKRSHKTGREFDALMSQARQYSDKMRNNASISFFSKLAKEYKFEWTATGRDSVIKIMTTAHDTDDRNARLAALKAPVAKMKGKKVMGKDIVAIASKWRTQTIPSENITALRNELLRGLEITLLPKKHSNYSYLKQEYLEGLLVFAVSQDRVWNAMPDSATIEKMYAENKARYSANGVFEGTVYICNSKKDVTTIKSLLATGDKAKAAAIAFSVKEGPIKQGEMDDIIWPRGEEYQYAVLDGKRTDGTPFSLEEARGMIIADYQQMQNELLGEELKTKHKPQISYTIE